MTHTEHLLTVLAEECAEVAQRASKAVRFGLTEIQPGQGDDNRRRIEKELADLVATAELLGLRIRDEDKLAKKDRLAQYMTYSQKVGTLDSRNDWCSNCGAVLASQEGRSYPSCNSCS